MPMNQDSVSREGTYEIMCIDIQICFANECREGQNERRLCHGVRREFPTQGEQT